MITIYGKNHCKWCEAARNLLDRKEISYDYIHLFEMDHNDYQNVIAQSGMKTVPIVKVGDRFIGGYDQLEAYVNGNGISLCSRDE